MDREKAMLELATAHAVALRLRAGGVGDDAIGLALAIPLVAVPGLVSIAESKLAAVLAEAEADDVATVEPRGRAHRLR